MTSLQLKDFFRQSWHPSIEELIHLLDGELGTKTVAKIEAHLKGCWSCRLKREKLDRLISAYMESRNSCLVDLPSFHSDGLSKFEAKLDRQESEIRHSPLFSAVICSLRQRTFFSGVSLRFAAGLLASVLLLFFMMRLSSVPPVSATELLQRSEYSEVQRILKVSHPVVYQRLHVRRDPSSLGSSESATWEVWNDKTGKRFQRRVEGAGFLGLVGPKNESQPVPDVVHPTRPLPAVLAELEAIFELNGMDFRQPLSPSSYEAWRQSIRQKSETVLETKLADGGPVFALTTTAHGPFGLNEIIEAELVVGAEAWHPVKQSLKVQAEPGTRSYELIETAFDVMALNTLPPSIFADLSPPDPPAAPASLAVPSAPIFSPVQAVGVGELLAAEVEAHYALHGMKACLGDPIQVVRESSGRIKVHGLAKTPEHKEALVTALEGIPLVTVKIQTFEEAVMATSSPSSVNAGNQAKTPPEQHLAVEIKPGKPAIQPKLEAYFMKHVQAPTRGQGHDELAPSGAQGKVFDLSNTVISLSQTVLTEAWAIRRLAERYPREQTDLMRPATRLVLEAMVRDHMTALNNQIDRCRALLAPVLSWSEVRDEVSLSTPQRLPVASGSQGGAASGWASKALPLFATVKEIERLILNLFGDDVLPEGQVDEAALQLLDRFRQYEGSFQELETAVLREFTVSRDALSLKA